MNPLIVALDVPTVEEAGALAKAIGDAAGAFKIGLELWAGAGPDALRAVDAPVFLDLKLHDIPTTVERAVRALAAHEPFMLTVHALGGRAMLEAAAAAKPRGTKLVAVTILTSLSDADLRRMGLPRAAEAVPTLAALALQAGCDGVVCAPADVARVRETSARPFLVVTPGVRPGKASDDHARALAARDAIEAGADYVVVGRPVTRAPDPRAAALGIVRSL